MMIMKRLLVLCLSLTLGRTAFAQQTSSQCPHGTVTAGVPDANRATQDACQQAIDLFAYMVPQLGIALTGGNATLGQGGALGGLGHFTVGLRGNVVAGNVPQVNKVTVSDTGAVRRTNYPTGTQFLGLPAVDAAVGLFKGIPLPLTNVGGIDLLLSASYVPKVSGNNVTLDPDSPLKIGYGVRIGALQESILVPGVSFTYLKRDLPKTTITGTDGSDSLTIKNLDATTSAWRIVASKSLIVFSLAAGVGQDKYEASTSVQATVHRTYNAIPLRFQTSVTPPKQSVTRTNYFADVSLNMILAKIIGEIGMVSGGTVQTYNQFDAAPDKSRLYGSVGVRIGF
jgi:hypothetical protein